jgi:hypothetical protein
MWFGQLVGDFPRWKGNSHVPNEAIPKHSLNPNVFYNDHKTSSGVPALSQMNLVHLISL